MQLLNEAVAFGFAVALFVGLMRIGAGPKPPFGCLVAGAVVGATLFTVGKQLLAWYLSTAAVVSAYGAAGSLVVLLMWIYFSSAVLLFSASCARALGEAGFGPIDYVALVDSATLEPLSSASGEMRLIAAATLGATRLIDNLSVVSATV